MLTTFVIASGALAGCVTTVLVESANDGLQTRIRQDHKDELVGLVASAQDLGPVIACDRLRQAVNSGKYEASGVHYYDEAKYVREWANYFCRIADGFPPECKTKALTMAELEGADPDKLLQVAHGFAQDNDVADAAADKLASIARTLDDRNKLEAWSKRNADLCPLDNFNDNRLVGWSTHLLMRRLRVQHALLDRVVALEMQKARVEEQELEPARQRAEQELQQALEAKAKAEASQNRGGVVPPGAVRVALLQEHLAHQRPCAFYVAASTVFKDQQNEDARVTAPTTLCVWEATVIAGTTREARGCAFGVYDSETGGYRTLPLRNSGRDRPEVIMEEGKKCSPEVAVKLMTENLWPELIPSYNRGLVLSRSQLGADKALTFHVGGTGAVKAFQAALHKAACDTWGSSVCNVAFSDDDSAASKHSR